MGFEELIILFNVLTAAGFSLSKILEHFTNAPEPGKVITQALEGFKQIDGLTKKLSINKKDESDLYQAASLLSALGVPTSEREKILKNIHTKNKGQKDPQFTKTLVTLLSHIDAAAQKEQGVPPEATTVLGSQVAKSLYDLSKKTQHNNYIKDHAGEQNIAIARQKNLKELAEESTKQTQKTADNFEGSRENMQKLLQVQKELEQRGNLSAMAPASSMGLSDVQTYMTSLLTEEQKHYGNINNKVAMSNNGITQAVDEANDALQIVGNIVSLKHTSYNGGGAEQGQLGDGVTHPSGGYLVDDPSYNSSGQALFNLENNTHDKPYYTKAEIVKFAMGIKQYLDNYVTLETLRSYVTDIVNRKYVKDLAGETPEERADREFQEFVEGGRTENLWKTYPERMEKFKRMYNNI